MALAVVGQKAQLATTEHTFARRHLNHAAQALRSINELCGLNPAINEVDFARVAFNYTDKYGKSSTATLRSIGIQEYFLAYLNFRTVTRLHEQGKVYLTQDSIPNDVYLNTLYELMGIPPDDRYTIVATAEITKDEYHISDRGINELPGKLRASIQLAILAAFFPLNTIPPKGKHCVVNEINNEMFYQRHHSYLRTDGDEAQSRDVTGLNEDRLHEIARVFHDAVKEVNSTHRHIYELTDKDTIERICLKAHAKLKDLGVWNNPSEGVDPYCSSSSLRSFSSGLRDELLLFTLATLNILREYETLSGEPSEWVGSIWKKFGRNDGIDFERIYLQGEEALSKEDGFLVLKDIDHFSPLCQRFHERVKAVWGQDHQGDFSSLNPEMKYNTVILLGSALLPYIKERGKLEQLSSDRATSAAHYLRAYWTGVHGSSASLDYDRFSLEINTALDEEFTNLGIDSFYEVNHVDQIQQVANNVRRKIVDKNLFGDGSSNYNPGIDELTNDPGDRKLDNVLLFTLAGLASRAEADVKISLEERGRNIPPQQRAGKPCSCPTCRAARAV